MGGERREALDTPDNDSVPEDIPFFLQSIDLKSLQKIDLYENTNQIFNGHPVYFMLNYPFWTNNWRWLKRKFIISNVSQKEIELKQLQFQTALADARLNYWNAKAQSCYLCNHKNHKPIVQILLLITVAILWKWWCAFDKITCNKNWSVSCAVKKWRTKICQKVLKL